MFINTSNISKLSNKKISNNENNSSYTIGLSDNVYQGKPDIFYTDIIYIQDTQQIWTHGVLYNCMSNTKSIDADLTDNIGDREIKDLLDVLTNKRIYIKGHTDAVYTNDGYTITEVLRNTQEKLVSSFNIKTINNKSILGSGNLTIEDSVSSIQIDGTVYSPENKTIDLGYISKNLLTTTSSSMLLLPNTYHRNTNTSLTTLTITLGEVDNPNIINEYFVEFNTSNNGTTISLPSSIKWQNGEYPTFENNTTYQISIVNNLGICTKFK